ncbi:hypothetical protein HYV88_06335 [Candidatus Woesearchaeota archaeon]|nr:hypothetical protein [Candidatus Woesearchaeota archaeon]
MEYWNDLITEKSFEVLQKIKKELKFILIGGWAAYLYTKALKSKDIDIIIDFKELEKIKLSHNLKKNENLKKYEIVIDGIEIDIYVPHYSTLTIPLDKISTKSIESFEVISLEELIILKQGALLDRGESEKGFKDKIDILSLLFFCDLNLERYQEVLRKNNIEYFLKDLIKLIKTFKEYKHFYKNPREFKLNKEKVLKLIR